MFIKDNLHPVMEKIVLLHELGHDSLHREEATQVGGFKEFNIFDMRDAYAAGKVHADRRSLCMRSG